MDIRLVRHATLVVQLDDRTLLVDPMLGDVGKLEPPSPFTPACNENDNPLVSLPPDPDLPGVLSVVEAAFVTHTHVDHFDEAAQTMLRKNLPIFCQPQDEETISKPGEP